MANPGYPPPMQPMHPMGMQPQMGQPSRPHIARQGTSRMVPIVVSAGLAVGVFCGLLFGVGTGEDAIAEPSKGNNVKQADDKTDKDQILPGSKVTDPGAAKASTTSATTTGTTAAGSAAPAAGAGSSTTAATGSAAAGDVGKTGEKPAAGAGSAAAPVAGAGSALAVKKVKLTVELTPEAAVPTAKISVDKTEITGGTMELELGKDGKKQVKVVVKASGYKTVEQKVDIDGDVTVKIELVKRTATPTLGPRPGGKKDGKSGKTGGGGGLIDI